MAGNRKKRIILYIIVLIGLIVMYFFGALKPVEKIISKALNPLMGQLYSASSDIRIKYNERTKKKDLLNEIEELTKEKTRLLEENIRMKTIEEENESLRGHLGFLEKRDHQYVIANVVSRGDSNDLSGITDTIVIDKGKSDGLYPDLAVVNEGGIVVGKIYEVKEDISMVYLVNHSRCKLAATIMNEEKTSGVTGGELGLTIKMEFIPQTMVVNLNDIVITSGLEKTIPRGLIIGNVMEVNKENNELWQTATIEPLVDMDNLIIVSILKQ